MKAFAIACVVAAAVVCAPGVAAQSNPSGAVGSLPWSMATLPGRSLAYLDSGGTGVPIVFLHAGSGSSGFWEHQIAAVRAAGYRFVAFDRVGSGRSTLDAGAPPGSAADDLQALAGTLRLDRFHLVG